MITFLTIENNNINIHSDPSIKSHRDSIHTSCDGFFIQVCTFHLLLRLQSHTFFSYWNFWCFWFFHDDCFLKPSFIVFSRVYIIYCPAITGWQVSQIQVLDDLAHFSTCIIDNTKLYTFVSGGDENDNDNGIHDDNHYNGNCEKDDKDFKIPKS